MARSKRISKTPKKVEHAIIGVDPGGAFCGWGVFFADGEIINYLESGTWNLKRRRLEGAGMQLLRLDAYLSDVIKEYRDMGYVVCLVFEEIRFHGEGNPIDAAHVYGNITGQIMKTCEDYGVPYRGIMPGTSRKLATGNGAMTKDEVREFLESAYTNGKKLNSADKKITRGKNKGTTEKLFDESDALCIALAHIVDMKWAE